MKKKNRHFKKGFSLVEMLVSTALFSVVMIIAVGIIIPILSVNKHTRATSIAMANIDAVLEKIFREASVGSYYHCGTDGNIKNARDCPGGNSLTAFVFEGVGGNETSSDDQIIYRLNSFDSSIEMSRNGGANYERLTDGNTIVDEFNVNVLGNVDDTKQPLVFIDMRGYIKTGESGKTTFALQTMISERFNPATLRP